MLFKIGFVEPKHYCMVVHNNITSTKSMQTFNITNKIIVKCSRFQLNVRNTLYMSKYKEMNLQISKVFPYILH